MKQFAQAAILVLLSIFAAGCGGEVENSADLPGELAPPPPKDSTGEAISSSGK